MPNKYAEELLHNFFYKELDELRQYYDDTELLNHLPKRISSFELDMFNFVRGDVYKVALLFNKVFGGD